jgi:hemerythrin-like domain-containing protein
MKATDLLKKQHREVESLFKKALAADEPDERSELVDRIEDRLGVHTAIEEEIFYPAFREEATTRKAKELVLEAYEEHHVVKLVLEELPDVDPAAESFEAKMTVLKELVRHHVEEEETEMFPAAEKKLGAERLSALAAEMEARASEIDSGRDESPGESDVRQDEERARRG